MLAQVDSGGLTFANLEHSDRIPNFDSEHLSYNTAERTASCVEGKGVVQGSNSTPFASVFK